MEAMASDSKSRTDANFKMLPLMLHDVEALNRLAREIWTLHYPGIISEAQIEYMLAQRYAPQTIAEELARQDLWWDKMLLDEEMIGFTAYFRTDTPGEMKLDTLYVHPRHQRNRYGAGAIDHVAQRARALACTRIVLAVNRCNAVAIAAYRKYGFEVCAAHVKDIGGRFVMDDYIMALDL
jgi:ribosomal protein S18 acetylase RimI-like enzyme